MYGTNETLKQIFHYSGFQFLANESSVVVKPKMPILRIYDDDSDH